MHVEKLEPAGQYFVKHARHASQPKNYLNFREAGVNKDAFDAQQQLLQFLQQESLEEQRINFLAMQARQQTATASTNKQLYVKELEQENEIRHKLLYQRAQYAIQQFLQKSQMHMDRYVQVREADIQQRLDEQAEAETTQAERTSKQNAVIAQYIDNNTLLKPIHEFLNKVDEQLTTDIFKYEDFKQYFGSAQIQDELKRISALQLTQVNEIELQSAVSQFSAFISSVLTKSNQTLFEAPSIDASSYPFPEPVDKCTDYFKLESFTKFQDFISFLKLASTLTEAYVNNQTNTVSYFQNELVDKLINTNGFKNEEQLIKEAWFMFKQFEQQSPVRQNDNTSTDEKPKSKQSKQRVKDEPIIVVQDLEPDYTVKAKYINLTGTKVIIVIGCRNSGKTRFTQQLVEQIKAQLKENDYQIEDELAIEVVNPSSVQHMKSILEDKITQSLQTPRYIIIDGAPVFNPEEINTLTRKLVEEQQQFIDGVIETKLRTAFPSRYVVKEPETKDVKTNAKAPVIKVEAVPKPKLTTDYSGIFRIFALENSYEEFLNNQFGRIFKEQVELLEYENDFDALVDAQLESKLTFEIPKNQNFAAEFDLFEQFIRELGEYFDQRMFGIQFRPIADDRVLQKVDIFGVEQYVNQMASQVLRNTFLLDFPTLTQARLNQKFMFKTCANLKIEFNTKITEYAAKQQEILDKMDPKKLKALQQAQSKEKKPAPVEYQIYDAPVIQKLKQQQDLLIRYEQQLNQLNESFQTLSEYSLKSVLVASFVQQQTTCKQVTSLQTQFSQLLTNQIQTNFQSLIDYQHSMQANLKTQDIVVGDYLVLIDRTLQESLQLVQKLYQSISSELKQQASDAVQLNKKLPLATIQQINNVIKQNLSAQKADVTITTDAQFVLVQFFQRVQQARVVVQQFAAVRNSALALLFATQASVAQCDFIYSDAQKSLLNAKTLKAFEPQIQFFDGSNFASAQIDLVLAGADMSVDRYLDAIEQILTKVQSTTFNQAINVSGDPVKIDLQVLAPTFNLIDAELGSKIKQELQKIKTDLQQFTGCVAEGLKTQQIELEKNFAKAGQICVGLGQKLVEKVGKVIVTGVSITDEGVELEVE
ncbi:Conserved_hypothetical protein [Hexamita inflata]|uniref:Uncharacterized protein n=1 Tax=Hexamita inflata TaxID=28002 RepID=A0AA86VPM5_9EUKA|nr:Conserved hypothetical protein [Hexamita inflata]